MRLSPVIPFFSFRFTDFCLRGLPFCFYPKAGCLLVGNGRGPSILSIGECEQPFAQGGRAAWRLAAVGSRQSAGGGCLVLTATARAQRAWILPQPS